VKWVAWDPLAFAAVFGFMAGLLYFREEAPRWCGFFAAATVVFLTAGVRPLLRLAHTQLSPGLAALIVMVGVVGAVLMFWLVVFKGHHAKPLLKRKGAGAPKSKKVAHHKAMLATVGAMAFTFLLVSNWHAIVLTGGGGLSQTIHGITQ
jgi:hypothetical protein